MGKDDGEYEETKVRVYKKVHSKNDGSGVMSKYIKPVVSKVFTKGDKGKEKRLTA